MRLRKVLLAVAMLLFFVQGCTTVPTFPDNGATMLRDSNEFGALVAKPDTYQGRAIRLAGRMVSVETSGQGTTILAEWLAFPEPGQLTPGQLAMRQGERFTLHYPGKLDSMGSLYGNKFIVAGLLKGTTGLITIDGLSKSVPLVEARCLHVWKTGDSEYTDAFADVEQAGFPPLEQTYCSNG